MFDSLPHRLEQVHPKTESRIYNDSKATNLHATCAAIDALESNIILTSSFTDKVKRFLDF